MGVIYCKDCACVELCGEDEDIMFCTDHGYFVNEDDWCPHGEKKEEQQKA